MPFAVIEGEPITQIPHDLYIPPDALEVFLEAFEGPLDLLLYLIKRQNLDILNIPIAKITQQYMQYIEVMRELQLELAAEYLVMAAVLAEIKSRMLLPRPAKEDEEEEDPRAELVRRLQEYERYKKAAEDIEELPRLERDIFQATAEMCERKVVRIQPDVSLDDLLEIVDVVQEYVVQLAHRRLHVPRQGDVQDQQRVARAARQRLGHELARDHRVRRRCGRRHDVRRAQHVAQRVV
ncbi:MAG: segregation/condensation protein A, partial [Gammaproteobacteria bacterium]